MTEVEQGKMLHDADNDYGYAGDLMNFMGYFKKIHVQFSVAGSEASAVLINAGISDNF